MSEIKVGSISSNVANKPPVVKEDGGQEDNKMSEQRIVFTNPDGSVGVEIPSGKVPFADVLAMVQKRPNLTGIREITTAELPATRAYRAAWDDSNPENFVGTNITKAKAIAHERRRGKRAEQLTPLDKEEGYISTTSIRKDTIIAEKQAILDANAVVQTNIDKAVDVADLLAIEEAEGII